MNDDPSAAAASLDVSLVPAPRESATCRVSRARRGPASKGEPFEVELEAELKRNPALTAREVDAFLRSVGFRGHRSSSDRCGERVRRRLSFVPGECVQHAVARLRVTLRGGEHARLACLVSRLCSSGAARFTWGAYEPEAVMRAIVSHYASFGGRPRSAVLEGDRRVWDHPIARRAFSDLDIKEGAADVAPYSALRPILRATYALLGAESFASVTNAKVAVAQLFPSGNLPEEKAALTPIDPRNVVFRWNARVTRIAGAACVYHAGTAYPMPPEMLGALVEVAASEDEVRIFGGAQPFLPRR